MIPKLPILVFLFSVLKVVVSQFGCGINEYLTSSVNPCNSCDIRGFCPQAFGLECDCFPGYFRDSLGSCVPPEACDGPYGSPFDGRLLFSSDALPTARCRGRDEEYRACGSACPATCWNRNPVCSSQCVPGCFCRAGYLKNSNGVCVRPNHCNTGRLLFSSDALPTARCRGRDEEYRACGSACPPTCWNRNPVCSSQCVPGCFCRAGYLKNRNGVCVRPNHCNTAASADSDDCGPNEEFRSCGSACPPSCDNLGTGGSCTQQCVVGCFCIRGYVRKDGKCVPVSECGTQPVVPRSYYAPPPYGPPAKTYPPVPVVKPPVKVPPPVQPYPPSPPPPPPPTPSPPPSDPKGCPDRNKCNKNCKLEGFAVGFCVGPGFLKCNCLG